MKYRKNNTRRDQKFWHQKMINMLSPDIVIGKMWALRLFDERHYSVRTLKAICFALEWYNKYKEILPRGTVRFNGISFRIYEDNHEIAYITTRGQKIDMIFVYDEEACTELISMCRPHEKIKDVYIWIG